MTDTSLHQIFEALGKLNAEVTSLRRDIQQSESRAAEGERRADSHRAAIHLRVDELTAEAGEIKEDVSKIIGNMETVKSDLASTKEIADEVRAWKQRGIGALAVVGIGASALTYAATQYYQQIAALFTK